jgi:hypothetical protein
MTTKLLMCIKLRICRPWKKLSSDRYFACNLLMQTGPVYKGETFYEVIQIGQKDVNVAEAF